ncbi:MAG: hypothetical protein JEZ06_11015, partial [Anaerolineaceae bacterium]|nr:hypothetical protein [Anaerolineaceae bacterium]
LKVRTPPPTPTPEIEMAFLLAVNSYLACGGGNYIEISMANVGNARIESIRLEVENTSQAYILDHLSNAPFVAAASCLTAGAEALQVGQTLYINVLDNAYAPLGDSLKITATVCSADNLSGVCATGQIVH